MHTSRSSILAAVGLALFCSPSQARLAPPVLATQGLIEHYNGAVPLPGACWGLNVDVWVGGDIPAFTQGPTCPSPAPRPGTPGGNNAVVVIGNTWGPTLVLGHSHGASGPVLVRLRTSCINGPCVGSACFPSQLLISGPLVASIGTTHNGVSATVPSQTVPNNNALIGVPWSCQATVAGGGCTDLSSALLGVIGNTF